MTVKGIFRFQQAVLTLKTIVPTAIDSVVRIFQPYSDSDYDVPLSSLQVPKADKEWKWRKQFKRADVEKCVFAEDGIVNTDVQDSSPRQVFARTVGLEGLLPLLKTESERYAEQNRRMFQTTLEELCSFLEINILMGIHKPKMKDYLSVDEELGNTLIQKTMTRDGFLEILQNRHFADKLQKLPPKESESFDRAWKLRPFFDHLLKHFQEAFPPESHHSIDEHMCKFKGKSLMRQYMNNKPIKWGFKVLVPVQFWVFAPI